MNNPLNYVADPEFLEQWFTLQNTNLWNLYRGFHSRVPERDVLHKQQDSTMTLGDSWNLLWLIIQKSSVGGGKFTVYIPAYKGNKAATLHFGVNLSVTPSWHGTSIAGMPGAPMGAYNPEASIEKAIANEREKWEMARRIEDLENAQGATSDIWEVLIDKVRELDPNQVLPSAIHGIQQMFQPRGVQLHGVASDYQEPPQHDHTVPQEGFTYHQEVVIPWLDSIRQHFTTDDEFWQFMNAVSTKFNSNPVMFKSMIIPPNAATNE